jgi:hypothetical protein
MPPGFVVQNALDFGGQHIQVFFDEAALVKFCGLACGCCCERRRGVKDFLGRK